MTLTKKTKDRIFIILMLTVPVAHFCLFWVYLNFNSITLAFRDEYTDAFTLEHFKRFIDQFKRDIQEGGSMKYMISNTLIAMLISNFVNMPLTIICTFALYKKYYGHTIIRVALYIPGILGAVTLSMMTKYIFDATGPVVMIAQKLGVEWDFDILQTGLLGNYKSARITYFLNLIGVSGSSILFFTGALNRIPKDLFDAAKLDGIGFFREFYYIALPLMWSTVGITWIMGLAGGWGDYSGVMLLTGGAYNTANFGFYLMSTTLSATTGAENFNFPAAVGLLLTLFVAPLTLVLRKLSTKVVEPVDF